MSTKELKSKTISITADSINHSAEIKKNCKIFFAHLFACRASRSSIRPKWWFSRD